jgi:hypothetical protein
MTENKTEKPTVDSALALEMWNAGKTLIDIALHFQCTKRAAQWAVERAEQRGLGIARRGKWKPAEEEPPMYAMFIGRKLPG